MREGFEQRSAQPSIMISLSVQPVGDLFEATSQVRLWVCDGDLSIFFIFLIWVSTYHLTWNTTLDFLISFVRSESEFLQKWMILDPKNALTPSQTVPRFTLHQMYLCIPPFSHQ